MLTVFIINLCYLHRIQNMCFLFVARILELQNIVEIVQALDLRAKKEFVYEMSTLQ